MTARTKALLALAMVILVFIAARFLPLQAWLQGFSSWVGGAGALGVLAFIVIYALLAGVGFPALPLTLAAGVIYGPLKGTLVVSPASTLGALLAFLLGRGFFRDWVRSKASSDARLGALDAAVAKEGWRLVALLRLSPAFPFNVLNMTLGATGMALLPYLLASWIAMLPGTFLFVSLGAAAGQASGLGANHPTNPWMLGIGILATAIVTLRVTQIARKALAKQLPGTEQA
ncbi:MAG: TVP38/TMEM64 family protein [Holophagaceae bacterium]|nr:TVP38/TMEM64 family protein [Holophagaceae bacterium]